MGEKTALLAALGLLGMVFVARWVMLHRAGTASPGEQLPAASLRPGPLLLAIGFLTDFFDTLGVGSFATTTPLFKLSRRVDDREIPGTMNVGHTVPTLAEAFIYVVVVQVEMVTLVALIAAAVAGAWLGAGVVTRLPKKQIQRAMGLLLIVAAVVIVLRRCGWVPAGQNALGLHGGALAIGIAGNALLGALMMLGIGLYAPCMILVSLLGMSATTAFPIMMGSCAFLMPVASLRFIAARRYDLRAALGLTLGGVPGVLVAAFLVRSLQLATMQWLVVAVVLITSVAMLRSASRHSPDLGALVTHA